jgi:hypothetical protein
MGAKQMLNFLCTRRASLLALFFAAVAAFSPARADGNLVNIATYDNNGVQVVLDTYTENDKVVGLIAMYGNNLRISFAFDRGDWAELQNLWQAAMRADGSDYKSVGSLAETGTNEKCVITIAGGPTVRLTIVDPIKGALVFDVQPSVVADFDTRLGQVASAVTN